MNGRMTRRTLLRRTAAAAGAIAGEAAFPVPALLASASPNSKLATVVIGSGGRGEASLMAAAEETLVAIADVDDARLALAAKKVLPLGARPKPFFDYRRMFDAMHKDIDAVFIATPDHHHAPASMAAMQLGKHVFCEKPCATIFIKPGCWPPRPGDTRSSRKWATKATVARATGGSASTFGQGPSAKSWKRTVGTGSSMAE